MEPKDYFLIGFGIIMFIIAIIKNTFFGKKNRD